MAKVSITFDTDNAAFDGNFAREVSHVLAAVTAAINNAPWTGDASGPDAADGVARDSNGNRIGEWSVGEDDPRRHLVDASHPLHSLNRDD